MMRSGSGLYASTCYFVYSSYLLTTIMYIYSYDRHNAANDRKL